MLQTKTVSPELLELLKNISDSEFFSEYRLVGGTSLALQIGHRNSIDLDFFAKKEINEDLFLIELSKFGNVKKIAGSKNILICIINNIKVDFVNHVYKFIDKPIVFDGINLATQKDIAAMKLHAIENRGTRKDFIDLYFLLQTFTLAEMSKFYKEKYVNHENFMMLKSLTYFTDANTNPEPKMFVDFNWEICKLKITEEYYKLKI